MTLATIAAENCQLPYSEAILRRMAWEIEVLPSVSAGDLVELAPIGPGPDAAERSRRFGKYIGYTLVHLPVRKDNAPLLNAEEARFASFAARMAFSSFSIRPPVKYGRRADSNAFCWGSAFS